MKIKRKNIFWGIVGIALFCYTIFGFTFRVLNDLLVNDKAPIVEAVIINEKNIYPNQKGINPEFSYSYQFEVMGKMYQGNSHDSSLKVGDTVEIRYYKHCPYFNKPLHPKE